MKHLLSSRLFVGTGRRLHPLFVSFLFLGLARGASLLSLFVVGHIVPTAIGPERFGIWMVISSISAMAAFADLGLGLGLVNPLTEAETAKDFGRSRRLVANTMAGMGAIAFSLGFVFWIIYPSLDWQAIMNTEDPLAASEAGPTVVAFLALFLIALPLSVGNRIWMAQQRAHIAGLFEAVGACIGIGLLFVSIDGEFGLVGLAIATAGGTFAGGLLSTVSALVRNRHMRAAIADLGFKSIVEVFRQGGTFFALQIGVIVFTGLDTLIISASVGNVAAGEFAIVYRLFSAIGLVVSLVMIPLWPAFVHARVRGDIKWIRTMFSRLLYFGSAGILLVAACMVAIGKFFVPWWTAETYSPGVLSLLAFGAWTGLWAIGSITGTFLNSMGVIKFQVLMVWILVPSALISKVVAANVYGVEGLLWATVLVYMIVVLAPSVVVSHRAIDAMAGKQF